MAYLWDSMDKSYDNVWDVMSRDRAGAIYRLRLNWYEHTIWRDHKDKSGWIGANQKVTVDPGYRQRMTLERLALPGSSESTAGSDFRWR